MHKSTKVEKFYLGIDYGMRKTGIAIAQEVTKMSRPLKIIYHNHIDEINEIIEFFKKYFSVISLKS